MNISVIIPNRDGREIINECLDALRSQSLSPSQVIVVDDGSRDESVEFIRQEYDWVELIELEEPRGFAGACAAGLEKATGEWIAILNTDAVPEPDWLKEMSGAVDALPKTGMIACRVIDDQPGTTIDSLGLTVNRAGMAFLREHDKKEGQDAPRFEEVFGPAGSALMYSREMIDEIGFFEPDYFAYYEDVDMAWRARWRGWRCVLANGARVSHRHSYTAERVKIRKRYYLSKNRLRTALRNWPYHWMLIWYPWILVYDVMSMIAAIKDGEFASPFTSRIDALRSLGSDRKVWRVTIADRAVAPSEMKKWTSIKSLAVEEGPDE